MSETTSINVDETVDVANILVNEDNGQVDISTQEINDVVKINVDETVDVVNISVNEYNANVNVNVEEVNEVVNIKVDETVDVVNISVNEDNNEVKINVQETIEVVNISVEEPNSVSFTLSDDLIIVTAGKQSNTFVNNIFTFVDTVDYTSNTKTLIYTGALLTSALHLFRYNSLNWNVNYTYSYNLGDYNGVNRTITKS